MNLTKQIVLCFSCRFGFSVVLNSSAGNSVSVLVGCFVYVGRKLHVREWLMELKNK